MESAEEHARAGPYPMIEFEEDGSWPVRLLRAVVEDEVLKAQHGRVNIAWDTLSVKLGGRVQGSSLSQTVQNWIHDRTSPRILRPQDMAEFEALKTQCRSQERVGKESRRAQQTVRHQRRERMTEARIRGGGRTLTVTLEEAIASSNEERRRAEQTSLAIAHSLTQVVEAQQHQTELLTKLLESAQQKAHPRKRLKRF